ncbi:MAG TPA: hypothetical protein VJ754_09860, partial [Anaerolineae bacterium]|nr:hypothetical protein [Anaerolineae bacterium]
ITGATTPLDFQLAPIPAGILRGSLTEAESGRPLSGTILVENTPVSAPVNGAYSLALPEGTYALRAVALAHRVLTASVTITAGEITTQDFALPPAPTILLVDSGAWYDGSQIGYYRAALDELGYTYDSYRVKRLPADAPMSSTLAPYDVVVWSAPLDSPGLIGSGDAISAYLSSGGQLFISGQDVGYWDGGLSFYWADYYYARLKALVEQDDAGPRWLDGVGIFDGIRVSLSDTHAANNQFFPDAIRSANPDFTADAFYYSNGLLGAQSVGLCLPYRAAYLAFGFEAIGAADQRREVMSRTLAYFDSPRSAGGATLSASEDVLIGPAGSSVTEIITLRNIAEMGSRDTFALTAQSPPGGWPVSLSSSSLTLDPCATGAVSVTVSIPPGTPTNASQAITVTARSIVAPALTVRKRFVVKSPAAALLVDDDRWYEVEGAYQSALAANGISFDRWSVPQSWAGPEPGTPSPEQLGWYPFVVWFTGYDWYQPLTANNEATLTHYLDAGGRVMISAQDYLAVSGLSDFGRSQLGILDHGEDMSTTLARGVSGGPFDGIGPLTLVYTYANFSDALAPYPTATVALVGRHGRPIALTRDAGAGKAMFLSFPFETIQAAERAGVMERIVGYLSWLGESSVSAGEIVAAPGADLDLEIVIHNDGPRGLASAAFSVSLPPGVSLRSGSTSWSGPLSAGQALTAALSVQLDGSLPPGSIVAIPVAFTDNDHAITFHKAARVGVSRPDLSSSSISVASNPARSASQVTWTLVARNTGLVDASSAIITGLLPFNAALVSGTLTSGAGSVSELSGAVKWTGSVPVNGLITITYRMTVPGALADRLRFGSALFDDGAVLSHAADWLAAQPLRVYLPQVYRVSP